jgi:hypothetical protein
MKEVPVTNLMTATLPELGHVRVLNLLVAEVRPSPENNELYRPVDPTDPEIVALADSIVEHGVQEPLLVTRDRWIISGHRRHAAAQLAGLATIPCRVKNLDKDTNHDEFMQLLRECNRQREKTLDEKLREEVVSASPEEAYQSVLEFRQQRAKVEVSTMTIHGTKRRWRISPAKMPFLAAIQRVIKERQKFWPLSVRQVHYALLNDPPLVHAAKADSTYGNTLRCYKALDELLTRARFEGLVPFGVIADETRPVTDFNGFRDCQTFLRQEMNNFLKGYWRDRLQSQPNHLELLVEKNTIVPILRSVAEEYCVPMTSGRGYCSVPPRYDIFQRFERSGKEKLVLLAMTDFDPDGEEIAHSMARSLRDDFGVADIVPVKVALTAAQVKQFNLPPKMTAKETSANRNKFVARHGEHVFELEALPPAALQDILREAIEQVIDLDLFNCEIAREEEELQFLNVARRRAQAALAGLETEEEE